VFDASFDQCHSARSYVGTHRVHDCLYRMVVQLAYSAHQPGIQSDVLGGVTDAALASV
jgi:hypothetical protein